MKRRSSEPTADDLEQADLLVVAAEVLWRELLDLLRQYGHVETHAEGEIHLVEGERRTTWVVTPHDLRAALVDAEARFLAIGGRAGDGHLPQWFVDDVVETNGSAHPDETFVVLDGARLASSTRRELPPAPAERRTTPPVQGGRWFVESKGRDGKVRRHYWTGGPEARPPSPGTMEP